MSSQTREEEDAGLGQCGQAEQAEAERDSLDARARAQNRAIDKPMRVTVRPAAVPLVGVLTAVMMMAVTVVGVVVVIEELARRDFLSPIQVRSQIKQARIELFGKDLRDSAIAYRLKKRRERGQRRCVEPECEELIPALANGRRRYCSAHGIPAARVRRHRYGVAGPAQRSRPYRRRVASEEASFLADLSPAQLEKLERVIFRPAPGRT